ncbi:hypothetical protein NON20_02530 [Synechocystis sp. B12]|nr:hypothetical protein NON20_02530 [Synechocystis sp. B12]
MNQVADVQTVGATSPTTDSVTEKNPLQPQTPLPLFLPPGTTSPLQRGQIRQIKQKNPLPGNQGHQPPRPQNKFPHIDPLGNRRQLLRRWSPLRH